MITPPTWFKANSQLDRLAVTIPKWLAEVPLYRLHAAGGCRHQSPKEFLACFQKLPVITKHHIQLRFPHNFLRPGMDLDRLVEADLVEVERTSGTSEAPTPLLLGRGWWDAQERVALNLNARVGEILSISTTARRITITSPQCNHDICYTGTPSQAERVLGHALSVNVTRHPFLWTEAARARMLEEALDWDPLFLDLDPVYGTLFALYCERAKVRFSGLKFIITSYEFLSVNHRRVLERVFGVPVYNLYGSTETGHLLMQDSLGHMVPSTETAFLEVMHRDEQGVGDLVVTTLTNDYMPLIRYGIGDLIRVNPTAYQDGFELHGRAKDALKGARGQRVTVAQVDACFQKTRGIAHYQLLQHPDASLALNFSPDGSGPSADDLALLRSGLAELMEVADEIPMTPVDYLPCESSGKFRLCRPLAGAVDS
jgi:phenylacetate-CoA ligase